MLAKRRTSGTIDLRANVHRIAQALDDLTRRRVLRLADADFAEYIKLTLPYAAQPSLPRRSSRAKACPAEAPSEGRAASAG